jgi:transposase InsO family protein
MQHSNAKLTPAGRRRLVSRVEDEGLSLALAARYSGVSKSTAWEWTTRWRAASASDRQSWACLCDRSSRPRTSPSRTTTAVERQILVARSLTGWGPRLIAGRVGVAHSTVHAVLARNDVSRPPAPDRGAVVRYQWPCPGDLLHMDTKRYARFDQPGHAVTGDRTRNTRGAGYNFAHAIIDDHSRLAYVELHDDERAQTVTEFVVRALAWYARHGVICKRLMTDNAFAYTKNTSLAALLADNQIRHLTTRPYRPQTNGKVERFHQTMAREWGYGMTYATDRHRAAALQYWIRYYNEQRPHSALAGSSPINRVRNLPGHDN